MTLITDEVNKAEQLFLKDSTIPDLSSTDNDDFNIVQTIIKRQLEGGETDKSGTNMRFSEETSTVFHHL